MRALSRCRWATGMVGLGQRSRGSARRDIRHQPGRRWNTMATGLNRRTLVKAGAVASLGAASTTYSAPAIRAQDKTKVTWLTDLPGEIIVEAFNAANDDVVVE